MLLTGASGGALLAKLRFEQALVGIKNGTNLVFTAPEIFLQNTFQLFFNGQRLAEGAANDYTTSESGGGGAGFDTITLLAPELAPLPDEQLFADYIVP